MKIIIAGTRDINKTLKNMSVLLLNEIIDKSPFAYNKSPFRYKISEVVSGGAKGIDTLGEMWAKWKCSVCYHSRLDHDKGICFLCGCKNSRAIPVKQFIPDWKFHNKAAGMIRNQEMGIYADGLIAIWDGESGGTRNMIEIMGLLGKPGFVWFIGHSITISPIKYHTIEFHSNHAKTS